jgi:hypothetical protein
MVLLSVELMMNARETRRPYGAGGLFFGWRFCKHVTPTELMKRVEHEETEITEAQHNTGFPPRYLRLLL